MSMKSGLEAGYIWLTQEKAERPDMSGLSLWNPARGSDISGMTGVFGGMIDF
jgi:hypothetical protein